MHEKSFCKIIDKNAYLSIQRVFKYFLYTPLWFRYNEIKE